MGIMGILCLIGIMSIIGILCLIGLMGLMGCLWTERGLVCCVLP